jgi:AICAR transformylase/IMP cyclohydrolase PurH
VNAGSSSASSQATGLPAAASFKHVSPAGAAVAVPLPEPLARACFVDDLELSPLACAYARARGADRLCSFGDSSRCPTPRRCDRHIIAREVSDGVIARATSRRRSSCAEEAGKYAVVRIGTSLRPRTRDVFGITFEQRRDRPVAPADFKRRHGPRAAAARAI